MGLFQAFRKVEFCVTLLSMRNTYSLYPRWDRDLRHIRMVKQSCRICYCIEGLNPLVRVVVAGLDKRGVSTYTYSPADCTLLLK